MSCLTVGGLSKKQAENSEKSKKDNQYGDFSINVVQRWKFPAFISPELQDLILASQKSIKVSLNIFSQ